MPFEYIAPYVKPLQPQNPVVDILSLCFTRDSNVLALGCSDATVRLFHARRGFTPSNELTSAMTAGEDLKSSVLVVGCNRVNNTTAGAGAAPPSLLTALCTDGGVSTWHVGSSKRLQRWACPEDEKYIAHCVDWASEVCKVGGKGAMPHYPEGTTPHSADGHPVEEALVADTIAFGCLDGTVRLTDPTRLRANVTAKDRYLLELSHEHSQEWLPMGSQRLESVRFVPQSTFNLVSGGWGRTVHLWDTRSGLSDVDRAVGPYLCGDGLAVHPQHPYTLLTASTHTEKNEGDNLQSWDLRALAKGPTASRLYPLAASAGGDAARQTALYALAPSQCGRFVAVAGSHGLGTIVHFDTLADVLPTGREVGELAASSVSIERQTKSTSDAHHRPHIDDGNSEEATPVDTSGDEDCPYFSCAWSWDGDFVAFGGSRGTLAAIRVF